MNNKSFYSQQFKPLENGRNFSLLINDHNVITSKTL